MADLYLGEFEQIVLLAILPFRTARALFRSGRKSRRGPAAASRVERSTPHSRPSRAEALPAVADERADGRAWWPLTPLFHRHRSGHGRNTSVAADAAPFVERPRRAARVMSREPRPPRLAVGLLAAVIGGDARGEGVLGDLHEEFLRDVETAPIRAAFWYWINSLRLSARFTAQSATATVRGVTDRVRGQRQETNSLLYGPEIP